MLLLRETLRPYGLLILIHCTQRERSSDVRLLSALRRGLMTIICLTINLPALLNMSRIGGCLCRSSSYLTDSTGVGWPELSRICFSVWVLFSTANDLLLVGFFCIRKHLLRHAFVAIDLSDILRELPIAVDCSNH